MPSSPQFDSTVEVHPQALCETRQVGPRTRIGAFSRILDGATIGAECDIADQVLIERDVVVGNRVTIKSGVRLWDGLRVADDVFIGPNAAFSNDPFPRSGRKAPPEATHIGAGASIGAGAVVLPGVKIGAHAMVGPGSVVSQDVPVKAIVSGNPARITGYADARRYTTAPRPATVADTEVSQLAVRGVTLHRLKVVEDLRGRLTVGEVGRDVPFTPRRYFMVFDVPGREVRGEHAHRECEQFLVCLRGSIAVLVDDGRTSEELTLDSPGLGLYVPPMTWAVQYQYTPDAQLLVLASHPYDPADYIRTYDEFLAVAGTSSPSPAG